VVKEMKIFQLLSQKEVKRFPCEHWTLCFDEVCKFKESKYISLQI